MSKKNDVPPPKQPTYFIFLNAGISGMLATCFTYPMFLIKNHLQVSVEGLKLRTAVAEVIRNHGVLQLYDGLGAALVRSATYTTIRLGVFNTLQQTYKEKYGNKPNVAETVAMAITAGSCGAFFGTPADLVLIRMSVETRAPPERRRNYKNVFDAFVRIVKEEGVTSLWKGAVPTITRAIIVNVSQLATYTESKNMIAEKLNLKDGVLLHFCASMVSGLITTFNSQPLDVAKTRIQNLTTTATEKTPGLFKIMLDVSRTEGITALYKGFLPTYCRLGPHTVLVLMFNEQITRIYREHIA